MDRREFEEHVADYVEGLCAEALRREMDEMRALDPACARLARLHENILATLLDTPPEKAPEGLSESILAAVAAEDKLVALENSYNRRWLAALYSAAACLAAGLGVLLYRFREALNPASFMQYGYKWNQVLSGWLAAENRMSETSSGKLLTLLQHTAAILNYPVQLPMVHYGLPVYYLIAGASLAAVVLYYHESSDLPGYRNALSHRS